MAPCEWVNIHRSFGKAYCLHLQSRFRPHRCKNLKFRTSKGFKFTTFHALKVCSRNKTKNYRMEGLSKERLVGRLNLTALSRFLLSGWDSLANQGVYNILQKPNFNNVFTRACRCFPSSARWINSTLSHSVSFMCILILSHIYVYAYQIVILPYNFSNKIS
jgi:hypothetical protein